MSQVPAYVVGALGVLVFVAMGGLAGSWNPLKLAIGADGRLSTSKFQWLLWNLVGIFAYVTVLAQNKAAQNFPPNLLLAMGFSIVTMAGSKAITANYVATGRISKPDAPSPRADAGARGPSSTTPKRGGLLADDSGGPDLSKIQLMTFTFIAIGAFLWKFFENGGTKLEDIDNSMMVLMGLSHGGYLGKKLVTTDTPRLIGITPAGGPPRTKVTLRGGSLGGDGNVLLVDGIPLTSDVVFTDSGATFTIPPRHPNGQPWREGQRIDIGAVANGAEVPNTLPFAVGRSEDPSLSSKLD